MMPYRKVFGDSYAAVALSANNKTFKSMMPDWGGSCYGMTATALLFYLDWLDWESYGKDTVATPNSFYDYLNTKFGKTEAVSASDSKLTELIEQYQVLCKGDSFGYSKSYEYKKMCVDLYRKGKWPDTPAGIKDKTFHDMIRIWVRREETCGPDSLYHKNQNKAWTAEEKYEYVAKVLAGESYKELAISAGIECSLLYQWVRRYKMKGYEGLVAQRKGRPPYQQN